MTLALTLPQPSITYVYWHVEVIGFKGVSHLAKALQSVFPGSLLKAKGFRGALTLLKTKGEHVTKAEAKGGESPKAELEYGVEIGKENSRRFVLKAPEAGLTS